MFHPGEDNQIKEGFTSSVWEWHFSWDLWMQDFCFSIFSFGLQAPKEGFLPISPLFCWLRKRECVCISIFLLTTGQHQAVVLHQRVQDEACGDGASWDHPSSPRCLCHCTHPPAQPHPARPAPGLQTEHCCPPRYLSKTGAIWPICCHQWCPHTVHIHRAGEWFSGLVSKPHVFLPNNATDAYDDCALHICWICWKTPTILSQMTDPKRNQALCSPLHYQLTVDRSSLVTRRESGSFCLCCR